MKIVKPLMLLTLLATFFMNIDARAEINLLEPTENQLHFDATVGGKFNYKGPQALVKLKFHGFTEDGTPFEKYRILLAETELETYRDQNGNMHLSEYRVRLKPFVKQNYIGGQETMGGRKVGRGNPEDTNAFYGFFPAEVYGMEGRFTRVRVAAVMFGIHSGAQVSERTRFLLSTAFECLGVDYIQNQKDTKKGDSGLFGCAMELGGSLVYKVTEVAGSEVFAKFSAAFAVDLSDSYAWMNPSVRTDLAVQNRDWSAAAFAEVGTESWDGTEQRAFLSEEYPRVIKTGIEVNF